MYNAYSTMRQAQKEKLAMLGTEKDLRNSSVQNNSPEGNSENNPTLELQNSIKNLENSISTFQATVAVVFEKQKMTSEQERKMNEIISQKQEMLAEMKTILTEIEARTNELQLKNQELSVYQNAEKEILSSSEISEKYSDLQKRILELDEEQSIFLKNFRLLHE